MKAEGHVKPKWLFSQIFEPAIDFFALLQKQSESTLAGVQALVEWLESGDDAARQRVLDLESQADQLKLDVTLERMKAGVCKFKARALVGDDLAVEADLTCTMRRVA